MRRNKWNNRKIEYDNIKFDSKAELSRYKELKILEKIGEINSLEVHPRYKIMDKVSHNGKTYRARHYTADFRYKRGEKITVVEEVKNNHNAKEPAYRLRMHRFLELYGNELIFKEVIK